MSEDRKRILQVYHHELERSYDWMDLEQDVPSDDDGTNAFVSYSYEPPPTKPVVVSEDQHHHHNHHSTETSNNDNNDGWVDFSSPVRVHWTRVPATKPNKPNEMEAMFSRSASSAENFACDHDAKEFHVDKSQFLRSASVPEHAECPQVRSRYCCPGQEDKDQGKEESSNKKRPSLLESFLQKEKAKEEQQGILKGLLEQIRVEEYVKEQREVRNEEHQEQHQQQQQEQQQQSPRKRSKSKKILRRHSAMNCRDVVERKQKNRRSHHRLLRRASVVGVKHPMTTHQDKEGNHNTSVLVETATRDLSTTRQCSKQNKESYVPKVLLNDRERSHRHLRRTQSSLSPRRKESEIVWLGADGSDGSSDNRISSGRSKPSPKRHHNHYPIRRQTSALLPSSLKNNTWTWNNKLCVPPSA